MTTRLLTTTEYEAIVRALREAQTVLAVLTEPKAIRSTAVHNAWAMAVAAEQKARLALALIDQQSTE